MFIKQMSSSFYLLVLLLFVPFVISAKISETHNEEFQHERILESKVNNSLECVRNILLKGIPEEGLPPMETITIPELSINLDDFNMDGTSGNIIVENASLKGLLEWQLSDLKIRPHIIGGLGVTVKAKLNFPRLLLKTLYDMNITANNVEVFGKGDIENTVGDFQLDLDTKYLFNKQDHLEKFRLLPGIKDFHIEITGWFNDEEHSEMVSQLCNDVVVLWINEKSSDFADLIEEFLMSILEDLNDQAQNFKENDSITSIINTILEECAIF